MPKLNIFDYQKRLKRYEQEPTEEAATGRGASHSTIFEREKIFSETMLTIPQIVYEEKIIEKTISIVPGEVQTNKLLDILSERNKMVEILKHDLETSDEQFSKTLDRILFGFIVIFLTMIYLFLIK